jgi:NAD(P)-dependent dehydrogenase (short-subunit alcohol dehydrogenase family)
MNISFEGKAALVTGAASGLGLATAKAFAESGASVALADWNEDAARAASDDFKGQGHEAIAIYPAGAIRQLRLSLHRFPAGMLRRRLATAGSARRQSWGGRPRRISSASATAMLPI